MIEVIALDLEGTLISNAVSQIPRPGLYKFLELCRSITNRVVIFTSVGEEVFRSIAKELVKEGYAPEWFAEMEYIQWEGETKNQDNPYWGGLISIFASKFAWRKAVYWKQSEFIFGYQM